MSQEYKVAKVSEQPPKEWQGEHGTIYYIKVKLDGHQKPVTIGKKKPDALKIGDTVYGDIQATDFPEDKFKPASPQQNNAEITSKLNAMDGKLTMILKIVNRLDGGTKEPGLDTVADVDVDEPIKEDDYQLDGEPVNLDDIPF